MPCSISKGKKEVVFEKYEKEKKRSMYSVKEAKKTTTTHHNASSCRAIEPTAVSSQELADVPLAFPLSLCPEKIRRCSFENLSCCGVTVDRSGPWETHLLQPAPYHQTTSEMTRDPTQTHQRPLGVDGLRQVKVLHRSKPKL